MSQSVWATSKASKRSRGQAQRRNPLSFTEEPKPKKMRVEDQDMSEETRREMVKKVGLQLSSDALVRRSPSSVPRLVISEFGILPTQPGPALDFYADSLYDQALRRSPAPSCVSIEHALSKLNKNPTLNQRIDCLYPTPSEKGETVIEICSNLIRSQEEFLAIGNLPQHEWKFRALIIAFGLLTRQVGDPATTRHRTFASAEQYFMAVRGQGSRFLSPLLRTMVIAKREDLLVEIWDEYKSELSRIESCNFSIRKPVPYAYTKKSEKARIQKPGAMIQFGNVYWESVGSLVLRMPEVDDIVTQVGLMCAVLVDTHILYSHSMSDRAFHHWSQSIFLRSAILTNNAGELSWVKNKH
ncbi:hypothetical protein BDR22DRAFT_593200 [Usnea florida]